MLFFRSEEQIDAWCRARNIPKRPVVSIPQLWDLATSWYGTRLDPDSRRPGPEEIRAIFHRIGLVDPFWDPQADRFG
jgi:hypothetical protein